MPQYFFHVHDGVDFVDHEGTELSGWREAQQQAVQTAGMIIAHNSAGDKLGEDWSMEVTDAGGLILFRLEFHIARSAAITEQAAPGQVATI